MISRMLAITEHSTQTVISNQCSFELTKSDQNREYSVPSNI